MASLKDVAFMGASTIIRLVFGVLTFIFLARLLGPNAFGVLMLWLSIATLLAMFSNYGFAPYLLKEIGANPDQAMRVMNEVFASKLLISGALIFLAACALPSLDAQVRWVFFLLLLATLADSTTDFLNVGYRVTNRFSSETRIAALASVCQFGIVVGVVFHISTPVLVASAFLISRLCVLGMTWSNQLQYFSKLKPASIDCALLRLRHGAPYALDFGLQSLLGQIDNIIIYHFLGPVAVGLHQAGMRVFLGGSQIANVLGNVYIPRVAAVFGRTRRIQHEARTMQTVFFATGATFGLTLAAAAELIVEFLFGSQFSALSALLPWFGLLFFVRFIAAAYGVILTATGMQILRARANLLHWILILLAASMLVPRFGNVGWLFALTIGNLLLASIYFAAARRLVPVSPLHWGIVLVGLAAFAPLLPFG